MSEQLNRGTGMLIIDVMNSNPNGDPDRENDPRMRSDGRGEISPVSVKHKIRELVEDKDSEIWREISEKLGLPLEGFDILESRNTRRAEAKKLSPEELLAKYWDARVFGTTFLEKDTESFIATGVAQFGLGVSLDPVEIRRMTTTKALPVQEDKSRGMAPLAYRVVSYGVYVMPFFINATAARKTACTRQDIQLMLELLPYIYKETASYLRPQVDIRHAFYVEHLRPRGTFNDFKIIDALTPARVGDQTGVALSWKDYDEKGLLERVSELNRQMEGKAHPVRDLMEEI